MADRMIEANGVDICTESFGIPDDDRRRGPLSSITAPTLRSSRSV